MPGSIQRHAGELEKLLEEYDSFDIIANLSFMNLSADPETYKEYAHEGLQAYVEYITLLCLKKPFRTSENRLIDGRVVQDIQRAPEGHLPRDSVVLDNTDRQRRKHGTSE